jgi:hypothetical protein
MKIIIETETDEEYASIIDVSAKKFILSQCNSNDEPYIIVRRVPLFTPLSRMTKDQVNRKFTAAFGPLAERLSSIK